ncbi:MAG: methyltransferase domain-containing protein [Myxococcota bacterium]|jgi:SAM-dependent methyltransferase|nr:methyltransferase domain-containing protein [Myxococcota bacterium]
MNSRESTGGFAPATPRKPATEQFAPVAADYACFSYHAAGPDLAPMLAAGEMTGRERVLDIGSGPGHTALLFAPAAQEVVATDPTEAMLDQGRRLARERGLDNVRFECTGAESLPFPDDSFDRVTSRQSAHHYEDITAAMREVARVLRPGGRFVLIDSVSPEDDAFDGFLNDIELLRDASHVRDYRVSEWAQMFAERGLDLDHLADWDIPLDFDDWVARSRTPKAEVEALRRCIAEASPSVRERFAIDDDCGWSVPVALVVGTWA